MHKLALACCFLFVLAAAAAALESTESCLELKVKCVKNGSCKKKYKEYKKKCSFADASCLGDEAHRQRCQLLSNILLDATVLGLRGRACNCEKHADTSDLIKCRMVYNLLHANPCTVYLPPAANPSFFRKSTTTTTTTRQSTTTTTTTTTTTEPATTTTIKRAEPRTNGQVVAVSIPLCSDGIDCEKFAILNEEEDKMSVQQSEVVEQKSDENVALSFITPILIACLSLFVIIVLTAFIIIKVHFSPVPAGSSRSSSEKRNSVLFNFSSATATTAAGAKTRSDASDLADQELIRVSTQPADEDDDDDFRQTA